MIYGGHQRQSPLWILLSPGYCGLWHPRPRLCPISLILVRALGSLVIIEHFVSSLAIYNSFYSVHFCFSALNLQQSFNGKIKCSFETLL